MQYATIIRYQCFDTMPSCPAVVSAAPTASAISTYRSTSAVAHVLFNMMSTSRRRLRQLLRSLMVLLSEAALLTFRAVAWRHHLIRAGSLVAGRGYAFVPPSSANGSGQALDDAIGRTLTRPLARVHAVIGGEVPANHERLHGCTIPSQVFRCVWDICTVLSIIHSDFAVVALTVAIGFV